MIQPAASSVALYNLPFGLKTPSSSQATVRNFTLTDEDQATEDEPLHRIDAEVHDPFNYCLSGTFLVNAESQRDCALEATSLYRSLQRKLGIMLCRYAE